VHHIARTVLAGLSAAVAAVAVCTTTARAFDRVESLDPITAGRSYFYYVKELDTDHQPIAGRTVTMAVQHGAGPDASVAPADASGHPTGPAGATATEESGSDGLAFFLLKTSTTPGDNEFTWRDDTYSGQVVVVGKALAGPTSSAHAATGTTNSGGSGRQIGPSTGARSQAARPAHLPPTAMPPLAAALLAFLLVLLVAPPRVARYVRQLDLPGGGLGDALFEGRLG